ncbi:CAP domain-containing protein [Micromonosporaceae bacterium Da 78-11]
MHGPVEESSVRPGRHRGRGAPTPLTLGLSITALLGALGAGVALLPDSLTGTGTAAETPAAVIAALTPDTGDGASAATPASPSTQASPSSRPPSAPASSAVAKPTATPGQTPSKTPGKTPSRTPTKKATAAATGLTGQENEVVRLVNVERDKAGCGAVTLNTKLRTAIRLHVDELGRHGDLYISHVSDDGRTFGQRAEAQGYRDAGGENVARGQRDAAGVMSSWMNSEGHRANILNCSFKALGAGAVKGVDGTIVWGQLFGRS